MYIILVYNSTLLFVPPPLQVEEGWWRGKLKNKIGVFPSNFVVNIEPSPVLAIKRGHSTPAQTKKNLSNSKENLVSTGLHIGDHAPSLPPKPVREMCKVLFPYEPQNEDELELNEGDIVTILSKELPDKGWWKGELKGKIGVFPDNFVSIIVDGEFNIYFIDFIFILMYFLIYYTRPCK